MMPDEKAPHLTMTPMERRAYAAKMLAELWAFHDEVRAAHGTMKDSVTEWKEIRAERDAA